MRAEMLARFFHTTYERLAPSFGYATREDTKQFDPSTPNGRLMVAVADAALKGPLSLPARLAQADVIRGRICRVVCFGVPDADLQKVLDLCCQLERASLDKASKELADLLDSPTPAKG